MIDKIKFQIANFILRRKIKKKPEGFQQSFAGFFKRSFTFLVIMPEKEGDFNRSTIILDYLVENKKHPTILTYDYRISLIPQKYKQRIIDITVSDLNKLDNPTKNFINKLKGMEFNAVIDLNRDENLFFSYLGSLVKSNIRIGFSKPNADKFYNLQISNHRENPEDAYKNFIKCIEMF